MIVLDKPRKLKGTWYILYFSVSRAVLCVAEPTCEAMYFSRGLSSVPMFSMAVLGCNSAGQSSLSSSLPLKLWTTHTTYRNNDDDTIQWLTEIQITEVTQSDVCWLLPPLDPAPPVLLAWRFKLKFPISTWLSRSACSEIVDLEVLLCYVQS